MGEIVLDRNKVGKNTGSSSGGESSGKVALSKPFYSIYGIILLIIVLVTYIILQTPEEPIVMLRRFAGTFGYLTLFLAIITSEYMAKIKKITGLTFIKAHHNLARIGFC